MGDFLKLQFLAVVQGLTEFLPVSSSGHLSLLKTAFGLDSGSGSGGPLLELLLHLGTLVAVLLFYRRRLAELFCGLFRRDKEAWRYVLAILVSMLPAGVLYFFCHDAVEAAFSAPAVVAGLLMCTGVMLLTLKCVPKAGSHRSPGIVSGMLIGLAQAVALLPGISRSGSTYCAARWLKIDSKSAFDFSFLMSVPVIGGAVLLKAPHIMELGENGSFSFLSMLCATFLSGAVGYASLKILALLRVAGKFWYFGLWCLAVGAVSLLCALSAA